MTQGLLTLHWFNPEIWYAFYKMREEQEIALKSYWVKEMNL
ncbi:MAG TPA: hypothetical protein VMW91_03440 [Desulfosporosinus sp.]|nr:hypothetical protein [Desulfosporosinus sp.]